MRKNGKKVHFHKANVSDVLLVGAVDSGGHWTRREKSFSQSKCFRWLVVGCCTLSTISRQVLLLPFTAAEPFRVEKDKLSQKADLKETKVILKEIFFINLDKVAK